MSVEKEQKTGVKFHFETRLRNGLRLRPQPPFKQSGSFIYGTFADYAPSTHITPPIVATMHDYDVRLPREEREQMVANTIALCEILYQQKLLEEQE
jgi:hypothetical protein